MFFIMSVILFKIINCLHFEYVKQYNSYQLETSVEFLLQKETRKFFKIDLLHDTNIFVCYDYEKYLNNDNEIIHKNTSVMFYNRTIPSLLLKGDILMYIKNKTNTKFRFSNISIHIVNKEEIIDKLFEINILGFPFRPISSKQFSLMTYLKENGNIKNMHFTIGKVRGKFGDLYIGEIPDELTANKHIVKFQLNNNNNAWNVPLWKVSLAGKEPHDYKKVYYNKDETYLNSFEDRIFVPIDFFKYLNETVFNQYYKKGVCFYKVSSGEQYRHYINCFVRRLNNFPVIRLHIGKYIFNLTENDLFYPITSSDHCFFIIQGNYYDNGHKWLLGHHFFEKHSIEFNYDNEDITFYTDEQLDEDLNYNENYLFNYYNESSIRFLFSINIIILIPCIILFLILKKIKVT